ncbi:MAG: hypothetical protein KIT28_13015, partial [Rubrivivax sp.]|nr:hypothetical protein [Rubrivivax sp.]
MTDLPFDPGELFIDGVWPPPADGRTLPLFNPSDGSPLAAIARGGSADILQARGEWDEAMRIRRQE